MRSAVLCYNLKGTEKGKKIGMIFGFLGYKVRHVETEEYGLPIGALAGIREKEDLEDTDTECEYKGEGFSEEMMVISAATEEMLDKALFLMKKEKVQVDLKAVVTPTNQEWDSLSLYEEIKKEHLYMKQKEAERKQED